MRIDASGAPSGSESICRFYSPLAKAARTRISMFGLLIAN
jgi:hypothetical protein